MATTIDVALPRPHSLQLEIIKNPAKRKIICAGRRFGKTTLAAIVACQSALAGEKVLLSSTTQQQTDAFWRYARQWLGNLISNGLAEKNESTKIIELWNEGQIRCKTGSNPDVLRGGNADLIVFDECAYLDSRTWVEVGAPMLLDTDGRAIFISTPKRRNWFFTLYNKALDPEQHDWAAWHATTWDNPYLSPVAIDEIASNMPEAVRRQELHAEFLSGEGQVFRRVIENATASYREPYAGRFVVGVDWAQSHDYTVTVVLDADTLQMVAMDRFNKIDWDTQRARIVTLHERWQPEQIIVEHNSIGGPNFDALANLGLPVMKFETTAVTKPPLIQSLVLAFERDELSVVNDPVLIGELEAYEATVSTQTGRIKYGAPEGLHDDCVMALALAWNGCNRPTTWVF